MLQKNILFLLMLTFLASPCIASTKTETYKLPNGLTVYLLNDSSTPAVSVYIGYKVGSRNEQIGKTGISHLLEHLLFRGTKLFPEQELNSMLYTSGAQYNAFTSYDLTVYYETLPGKYLEKALMLEADRMKNSELAAESIAREKGIVTSELEGYKNDPASALNDEVMNVHFRSHSYRWPVIGYKSDVNALTRNDILDYYSTYYAPNNAILAVAGNFDKNEAKKLIEKYFASIPKGKEPVPVQVIEPPPSSMNRVFMEDPGKTSYLEILFHADKITGDDYYALKVLDSILYSGKSSRLYKALVTPSIASGISTNVWDSADPGVFDITAAISKGSSAEQVETIIFDEIEKIKENPPTEKEMEKVKNTLSASFIKAKESIAEQALAIVYYGILGNPEYVYDFSNKIKKITPEQVSQAAKKYLIKEKSTIGYLKGLSNSKPLANDKRSGENLKKAYFKNEEKKQPASLSSETSLNFQFEKFTLPNGLTVIVKENPSMPSVRIGGYVKNSGAFMDPKGQEGIASLTASMLECGTKTKTFEEISEIKDFNAFLSTFQARTEKTGISGWTLKEKLDVCLELTADMMINPTFPEKEFTKRVKQRLDIIDSQNGDPGYRAINALIENIYPTNDRRAHSLLGTQESIKSLTTKDIKKFYETCYRPENTVIILLGQINLKEAKQLVDKYWGHWKNTAPKAEPPKAIINEVKPERINVYMEGKTQNRIALGAYGVSLKDKDYCAFNIFNNILGGGSLNSLLGKEIRVEKGLVYGIYSSNSSDITPPLLIISAGTSSENVDKVIDLSKEIIKNTIEKGVTEKEFLDAKSSIGNSLIVNLGDPDVQMGMLEQIEYHNLDKNYPEELIKKYEKLTIEEVNQAGAKHFHPDKMKIVVAGSYKE